MILLFSPDGRTLAIKRQSADSELELFNVSTGTQYASLSSRTFEQTVVVFSPDSASLAHVPITAYNVFISDLTMPQKLPKPDLLDEWGRFINASPDGSRIAISEDYYGPTAILDARGNKFQTLSWQCAIKFSSDATRMVIPGTPCSVRDVDSGNVLHDVPCFKTATQFLFCANNNRLMVYDDSKQHLEIWKLPEEGRCPNLEEPFADVVAFPSGVQFAIARTSGRVSITDGEASYDVWTVPITGDTSNIKLAVSPGGDRVAVLCNELSSYVWNLKTRTLESVLITPVPLHSALTFSSDGTKLLYDAKAASDTLSWPFTESRPTLAVECDEPWSSFRLAKDGWILYRRKHILWLPPEYRPLYTTSQDWWEALAMRRNRVFHMTRNHHLLIVRLIDGEQRQRQLEST